MRKEQGRSLAIVVVITQTRTQKNIFVSSECPIAIYSTYFGVVYSARGNICYKSFPLALTASKKLQCVETLRLNTQDYPYHAIYNLHFSHIWQA